MLKKSTKFIIAIFAIIALVLISVIGLMALGIWGDNNTAADNLATVALAPITARDHLRGSLSAPVVIVEFADLECPYCKELHATLKKITGEYPDKVAWIYRHYPVDSLHAKSRKEAEAAECAGELGGNKKFWQYVDYVFNVTPSNDGLDATKLPEIATAVGLDREKFSQCLLSGKYAAKIENDLQQALIAIAGGRQGTPYSVIMVAGRTIPVSGVPSYEQLKTAIDSFLSILK
jgi:protein-disulfide isomerase